MPHTGAALPVLADRIAGFAAWFETADPPVDVMANLRSLFYGLAGTPLPRAPPELLALVGPDCLLYGSDDPFSADWVVHGGAQTLADSEVLTLNQQHRMVRATALTL